MVKITWNQHKTQFWTINHKQKSYSVQFRKYNNSLLPGRILLDRAHICPLWCLLKRLHKLIRVKSQSQKILIFLLRKSRFIQLPFLLVHKQLVHFLLKFLSALVIRLVMVHYQVPWWHSPKNLVSPEKISKFVILDNLCRHLVWKTLSLVNVLEIHAHNTDECLFVQDLYLCVLRTEMFEDFTK